LLQREKDDQLGKEGQERRLHRGEEKELYG
jgi:hypothetical protein